MKVGLVSIYPPPKSKHANFGGVSSYAKNLASSLSNHCKITVFADKLPRIPKDYSEDGVTVCRCWNKGVIYPLQIIRKISKHEIDLMHIQHEIFLYGSISSAAVFPLLLLFAKLLQKPTVTTIHGVLPLSKVDKQFLKENGIKGPLFLLRAGLLSVNKLIARLSTVIIVHEERLRDVLINEYHCPGDKIYVIHHGIEERNYSIDKAKANKILDLSGKKVILFFGYITAYKNVELLIKSARFLKTPNWVMIIAGGLHPRLSSDPDYREYISNLQKMAQEISKNRIIFTGFVPEEKIPLYFSAADLVVFPYTICMHASGPLAVSILYEKPFLISDSFKEVFSEDVLFRNNPQNLAQKIDQLFKDAGSQIRNLKYVKKLKEERSWSNVAEQTLKLYRNASDQRFPC
jgi:glycosyltransferase involved in cell wall biosynthesis